MNRIGLYSGSFDPVTYGHLDIMRRAATQVDRLVVAVGAHHGKSPLFTPQERCEMLRQEAGGIVQAAGAELDVTTFSGLVVEAAQTAGAAAIFRGLRDATDFDYEMQMAGMNATLAPAVETVFLPASADVRHIAASLVRQVAAMGGDVSLFVPARVAAALTARLAQKS